MKLKKITASHEIYEDEKLASLFRAVLIQSDIGNLINVAQAVYSKTQGRLYVLIEDENNEDSSADYVGFIGGSMVNNDRFNVKHYMIPQTDSLMTWIGQMRKYEGFDTIVFDDIRDSDKASFEKSGFKVIRTLDNILDQEFYQVEYHF